MNKFLAAAAAAGLTAFAAPAFAQNIEGSIGYSSVDLDPGDLGAITARVTWNANDIFGIEGEASFGVRDETVAFAGPPAGTADVELKHAVAVYGVAGMPVGENGRVFARVGYGTQEVEASNTAVAVTGDDQSVNYGVGASWFFDGRNGVRGDWTRHDFNDGGDADVWSVSYVRRF